MTEELTYDAFPLPQSSGSILPGGDCGYCCAAGVFGIPSLQLAYEFVEQRLPAEGGWRTRANMTASRWKLLMQGCGLEYRQYNPAFEHYKAGMLELPWQNLTWMTGVADMVTHGDVLVLSTRFHPAAPPPPEAGQWTESDHNVIVNGCRERFVPQGPAGCGKYEQEIRVSCSVKGTYWTPWSSFVYFHVGGAGCIVNVKAAKDYYAGLSR